MYVYSVCNAVWCGVASYMWIEVHTMCMHPNRLLVVVRRLYDVYFSVYVRYVRITRNIMLFKAFSFLLLAITPPCMFDVVYQLNLAYLVYIQHVATYPPPQVRQQRPKPTHFQNFFIFIFFCTSPCTLRFGLSRFSFVLSEFCISCGKVIGRGHG